MNIRKLVHARGLRFRKHAKELPGTPDLVFPRAKVAVFVDGDFWHGWRFPQMA
jgi:DNA mismatch endonuclease (patch repair protein)